jgi:hypothetical protein
MRKKLAFIGLCTAVAFLICPSAHADSWTLGLLPPSGAISGPAGATIGWGYTITNLSNTQWLVLSGISADPFQHATPNAIFNFPIVAPGTTVTLAFDPNNLLGLFALTWDTTAPFGFTNSGTFIVNGEWWDGDPFVGGNFLSFAPDGTAAYSATVVPEPGSLLLLGGGAGLLLARKRKMAARHRYTRREPEALG